MKTSLPKETFSRPDRIESSQMPLLDGSRVGIIGGGPAGSFFAYFLLDMAERAGVQIAVDIYEPRDFFNPGPVGCNMCAGIVSETLVQNLAAEGINLPDSVVQRGIDSYILHMDVGSVRIDTPLQEKRIGAVYRGAGPRDLKTFKYTGLDGHLLQLALDKGAQLAGGRVTGITLNESGRPCLKTQSGESAGYDLISVTSGVNSPLLKAFEPLGLAYRPPETTKTYLREYYLGAENVSQALGNAIQVFLLDIPRLEFGMLIPKQDYMTVCLLGEDIDKDLVQAFLGSPEVQQCLPEGLLVDSFSCQCSPRINTVGAQHPFADRFVFIGDSGSTRLFKDGIGSAYRAAKAAASTAIFHGVSAQDFEKHYLAACQAVEYDNDIGRLIFMVVSQIQKRRFARKAVLRMILDEQGKPGPLRRMSTVQWDMYTGSSSYQEVIMRTLHPAFLFRFARDLLLSLFSRKTFSKGVAAADLADSSAGRPSTVKLGSVYNPGEVLLQQGESGDGMFVIQEGQVAIMQEREGEEVFLGVRGPGEVLGEISIFERQVHSATVRALSEVRVITVDKDNFQRRIHEDPSLAYHLFQLSARRIRELSHQIAVLNQEIDRLTEN